MKYKHWIKTSTLLLLLGLFLIPVTKAADENKQANKLKVQQKLALIFGGAERGIKPEQIKLIDSEVVGFYIMQYAGQYGLVSKDGQYYLSGDAWNIDKRVNLTDNLRLEFQLSHIKNIDTSLAVSFKADNEKTSIWVFTDIDCFYCRKLHAEVPELNKLGVSVHYLSFPRSGNNNSADWKKAIDVWCSKDQQTAMTASKSGKDREVTGMPKIANCTPQIAEQYDIARKLGVRATPTIVLANGEIVSGYLPANQLSAQAISNTP